MSEAGEAPASGAPRVKLGDDYAEKCIWPYLRRLRVAMPLTRARVPSCVLTPAPPSCLQSPDGSPDRHLTANIALLPARPIRDHASGQPQHKAMHQIFAGIYTRRRWLVGPTSDARKSTATYAVVTASGSLRVVCAVATIASTEPATAHHCRIRRARATEPHSMAQTRAVIAGRIN